VGGHLEVVRGIVADAIVMARQVGLRTTRADGELARGDIAYAAGRYVDAYDHFRAAYQELGGRAPQSGRDSDDGRSGEDRESKQSRR
jgi:hypothetical protein